MTLPRSVAEVLASHVRFEIECVDRMYCHVYVPGRQSVPGAVWFCRTHLGQPYASTALLEPISRRFLAAIDRFATDHGIARVDFATFLSAFLANRHASPTQTALTWTLLGLAVVAAPARLQTQFAKRRPTT
jgi:hypothetical protein